MSRVVGSKAIPANLFESSGVSKKNTLTSSLSTTQIINAFLESSKEGTFSPDVFNVTQLLGRQGPLTKALPNFEYRSVQIQMAQAVEEVLSSGRHLLVEAGTGVGKSFAYLIPAILYAQATHKKVVISTHTISLQEQLIDKDIPFLKEILPVPFKAVLVKGRGNYLSRRRLKRAVDHSLDLFQEDGAIAELAKILKWSSLTREGSLQDFHEQVQDEVWDKVVSDADNCLGKKCPTYASCFFFAARKKMEEADLLIVNHHLFFSDLALRRTERALLPKYDAVIFDEAHTLEQVATEHMGIELSSGQVRFFLDGLFSPEETKGFLVSMEDPQTQKMVRAARKESKCFFKELDTVLDASQEAKRIRRPHSFSRGLALSLREIQESLTDHLRSARTHEEELDMKYYRRRSETMASSLEHFIDQDLDQYVYWVSRARRRFQKITLHSAPIHCGPILHQELFQKVPTVIMTSATLAPEGSFQYYKDRIGVQEAQEVILGSPFDYRKQVKLFIPRGMPEPDHYEPFRDYMISRIQQQIGLVQGGVFVLFTSYRLMQDAYTVLKPFLDAKGLTSFKQGETLSRHEMLKAFKEDKNAVLFGTESFWQGVDVPGKALTQVIITKLPFAVPDHPVTEARIEELEARGMDPFLTYTLPEAILKLKQGFGRLIRTQKDQGRVVILDDRILRKPYGQRFLNSLPECHMTLE